MVVRDDVILATLVERTDAGWHRLLRTQIRTTTVEHPDGQVCQIGNGNWNRV